MCNGTQAPKQRVLCTTFRCRTKRHANTYPRRFRPKERCLMFYTTSKEQHNHWLLTYQFSHLRTKRSTNTNLLSRRQLPRRPTPTGQRNPANVTPPSNEGRGGRGREQAQSSHILERTDEHSQFSKLIQCSVHGLRQANVKCRRESILPQPGSQCHLRCNEFQLLPQFSWRPRLFCRASIRM